MIFKKRDIVTLIIMSVLALLPAYLQGSGLLASFLTDFSATSEGFWLFYLLFLIPVILVLYYGLFAKRFEKAKGNLHLQNASDDTFTIFFLLGWIFYLLTFPFRSEEDAMKSNSEFYLLFLIISLTYIVLKKIGTIISMLKLPLEERRTIQLFEITTKNQFFLIIAAGVISYAILYGITIPLFDNASSGQAILISGNFDYLLFQLFCSIPVEEYVFRGLTIDVTQRVSNEILFDLKKVPPESRDIINLHEFTTLEKAPLMQGSTEEQILEELKTQERLDQQIVTLTLAERRYLTPPRSFRQRKKHPFFGRKTLSFTEYLRFRNIFDHNAQITRIESWGWWVGILISSITFAFYHIPRYGWNLSDIIFLTILGATCGLMRRYFGLLTAYLIHLENNFLATIIGSINPSHEISLVLTLLLLALTVSICFVIKKIRKPQRKPK